MQKERKTFTDSRFYPVLFMIILTVIFVGILATFYHRTSERVQSYRKFKLHATILKLFDLPKNGDSFVLSQDEVEELFTKHIVVDSLNVSTEKDPTYVQYEKYYKLVDGEKILGYAFPLVGSGLWGTIEAIISVSPDFKTIRHFEIITQNETPGLGGRIDEKWFKDQFIGKQIVRDNSVVRFQLIPEEETPAPEQINQITGATASSGAIVKILHDQYLKKTQALGHTYE